MKKYIIPLVNINIEVYVGIKEWPKYIKACKQNMKSARLDTAYPGKGTGESAGGFIWIDVLEQELFFHEIQHLLDNIFDYLDCKEEPEFKACLAANIQDNLLTWFEKESK